MIKSMSLSQVASVVDGELVDVVSASLLVSGVSIDTRTLTSGDLFIAIKGPRFDGHNYLAQAADSGAVAALTEKVCEGSPIPQIVVTDARQALGLLGAANRDAFEGCLVGVTGSCGKTSVKEMLQAIFSEVGSTLATEGNLNNDLGVPLTLLKINSDHQFAVIEMGTSAPGEIEYIANLGRPNISLITNAAETHLADLKTVAGVAQEKGYILDALSADGIAVLNMDDHFFPQWQARALQPNERTVVSFSSEQAAANVFASDITPNQQGTRFTLHFNDGADNAIQQSVQLAFWGRHQISNACCAAAVAMAQGLTLDIVARGLENARPFQRRGQRFAHESGAVLIDETYNANPKATLAAVDQLADCEGIKIMVLGDMLDLGEVSDERHRDVGRYAKAQGVHVFLSFGASAHLASDAFGDGHHFAEKSQLVNWLSEYLGTDHSEPVSVMVKGSRGVNMTEIVQALTGADEKGEA
ncbi:UDP-N-acetylmuramoyl-tripeptide--D-alanyl-D-alanine ligase [Endozoicomonas ascidiicola]|uniref:UDP-N-acetylmuramoyl-tripeptide--D-alanyl-D- alanine ligase n=1 Tax=Endozoicomonas ascidiicola TaxID=1698521 RepID=UPI00082BA840|nr:UDP-N-acetylmuramoyl-tripeptide--D-alanyl-D-alanine ligase [Endozoicomonas ascidiicola]